jgi:hypothetical protein
MHILLCSELLVRRMAHRQTLKFMVFICAVVNARAMWKESGSG